MTQKHEAAITTAELRKILALAETVKDGATVRVPIASQIVGFAIVALFLRDLLGQCAAGDARAIAAAREITGAAAR